MQTNINEGVLPAPEQGTEISDDDAQDISSAERSAMEYFLMTNRLVSVFITFGDSLDLIADCGTE